MEDYLRKIRDLEKSIDKIVESSENQGVYNDSIEKSLNDLQELIEKSKNLCTTQHEEKYLKQYSNNASRLKKRAQSLRVSEESKKLRNELLGNSEILETTAIDLLVQEGNSLDTSLGMSGSILQSAQDVKMSLAYQKDKVMKTSEKIVKFVEMVPGVSGLIGKISRRKRFNAVVIGLAFCICLIITVIYLF
jgi:hypothetical protein